MIELTENELYDDGRNSSKGNQLKWKKNGFWYKADYTGYEGLAEYIVSHLLKYSDLSPDEYVLYETEEIKYKNTVMLGCKSQDFLKSNEQLITVERLFKNQTGKSLSSIIWKLPEEDRAEAIVNEIGYISGIDDYGKAFLKMMTVDALFLNEDRHTHNIALIEKGGKYFSSPIFDNGAAVLSDTTLDYPLGADIYLLINDCKAKTFNSDFVEQLSSTEKLFGKGPRFRFGWKEVEELLDREPYYSEETKNRVGKIIMEQRRKYQYLFE